MVLVAAAAAAASCMKFRRRRAFTTSAAEATRRYLASRWPARRRSRLKHGTGLAFLTVFEFGPTVHAARDFPGGGFLLTDLREGEGQVGAKKWSCTTGDWRHGYVLEMLSHFSLGGQPKTRFSDKTEKGEGGRVPVPWLPSTCNAN
ncbi:hypothetical protein BO83DRAFT_3928 [Aspergillus eucalypticola CBS 122712]|uniref:Uncharacterized protein n=1 Tax=Aspergillus eucalypticola (strain CBS 122712 / IBT 29274) TaxID=1448314 RepID=A0A317WJN1_ASPEC|nr:uncharacterized protein BO83DRAFT_3928 [Aspergillus eucalypticola CBS 122712]PWY85278.1 hypothetical protein BO83DRAFT_3928 [Aspergillus eucalypticola CBS 122712]